MWAIAVLFFVKASILALAGTPLFDVPDEVGHLATVTDLVEGRGVPRSGRSTIPPDLVARWKGEAAAREPVVNWVAIHPPGYHLLAAPFLSAVRALTSDPDMRLRAPRLLSAIAGAGALLLFFAVLRRAGADPLASLAGAGAVGFLPMFSHMASGVSNDTLVALAGGAAALFWMRLLETGSFADGCRLAVALAAAGGVKMTTLPLALALLLLVPGRLAATGARRIAQWSGIAAIALSLPGLWVLRQWATAGRSAVHTLSGRGFDPAALLAYLRDFPVADHTFKNFVGLMGWTGSGAGEVRWFQISGVFLFPWLAVALAALVLTVAWCWRTDRGAGIGPGMRLLGWAPVGGVFLYAFGILLARHGGGALVKRVLYGLLLAVPFLAIPRVWTRRRRTEAAVYSSLLAVLVFSLFYVFNAWEAFRNTGQMRATHGRYFFVAIPFLLSGFALPGFLLFRPGRPRDAVLLGALLLLAANEAAFFLLRVLPFYAGAAG